MPLLGYQQAQWLVQHQDDPELAEFKALCGKFYIDFPGLIVVDADGYRGFACLHERGGRWFLGWGGVDDGLGQSGRVASARKQEARKLEPKSSDTLPLEIVVNGVTYVPKKKAIIPKNG